MKYTQQTYIDLKPEIEALEPKLSPLAFTVRRDAKIVLSYELRKYSLYATKRAAIGLKTTLLDVLRGAEDCFIGQPNKVQ